MALPYLVTLVLLNALIFIFTAIMAIAGVGAAFIAIPLIYYFGFDFLMATTIGLLLNTFSTGSASIRHHKQNSINYHIALPLIIASIITTPLGAIYSDTIPRATLRLLFALFLLLVGTNILYKTYQLSKKEKSHNNTPNGIMSEISHSKLHQISKPKRILISLVVGMVVGFLAGLLGVGGGSLILPFLLYFGLETKKAAGTTSFIVVFSSLLGFLSKMTLTSVALDWVLTTTLVITTILAALLGSYLMHFKLNKLHIRYTMAIMLLLVGLKILIDVLF